MYSIYRLIDPRDYSVGYIGVSRNVEQRYRYHIGAYEGNDKWEWIQRLKSYNLLPVLSIIETAPTLEEAKQKEAYWIEQYLERDEPLTNSLFPSLKGGTMPGKTYHKYSNMFRGTTFECEENKRQRARLRSRL